jgi:hypothetical protein
LPNAIDGWASSVNVVASATEAPTMFAFEGRLWPALIGGDMGCGVRLATLPRLKARGDALERRVRAELDEDPLVDVDPAALLAAAWHRGPRGLAEVDGVPEDLAELAAIEPEGEPDVGAEPDPGYGYQLDCYKPIAPVIDALEAAGAATRVAATIPLVTVKQ